jgi:hypothetical protein
VENNPKERADQDREEEASGKKPGEGELVWIADAENQGNDKRNKRRDAEADETAAHMLVVEFLLCRK